MIEFASTHNIDILCFPSHIATNLLQPLDAVPFKELKRLWKARVHDFVQEHAKIDKQNFLELLRGPLYGAMNPQYIEKGKSPFFVLKHWLAFQKTGMWPLNKSKVDKWFQQHTPGGTTRQSLIPSSQYQLYKMRKKTRLRSLSQPKVNS